MGTWLRQVWARLRTVGLRGRRDRDLREEVQAHLDFLADDYRHRGLSSEEARLAARRAFGAIEPMRERYRDQLGLPTLDTLVRDIRYGLRALRRHPAFAAAAIASIALGIGVNCAVFTVLNAALLQELPVSDPATLAAVTGMRRDRPLDFSYPIYRDLSSRQRSFTGLAASGSLRLQHLRLEGAAEEIDDVDGGLVSTNYFSLLGVRPARGRLFAGDDDGATPVAVISDGFWQRQFGGDPSAVGRTLLVNGTPCTIIGVTPRGFFGDAVGQLRDLWIPIQVQPRLASRNLLESRTSTWFRTIGRLKPGVTATQASVELTALFQQLKADEIVSGTGSLISRETVPDFRVDVQAGSRSLNRMAARVRQPLTVLMAVVAIVLLIACCNVANLLLARGVSRRREIAIRMAIGCSRGRLIAQMLIESLVMATLGGALGLLLASWTIRLIVARAGIGLFDLTLDSHVIIFTALLIIATGLIFGLVPALQSTALRSRATPARQRLGRGIIAVQVGLSLWLLIGAGLVIRSLWNLRSADAGVDRAHVLTVAIQPGLGGLPGTAVADVRRRLIERLTRVPGVSAVAFSEYGLFSGSATSAPVRVPGSPVNPERDGDVRQNIVTPDYFQAVGMTLLRGRPFTAGDGEPGAPRVAIINETMARHYFGTADPIGRLIYFPEIDAQNRYIPFPADLPRAQGREIIGVVRDAKYDNLRQPTPRMTYLPMPEAMPYLGTLHLRASTDPAPIAAVVPAAVRDVDKSVRVRTVTTLEADLERTFGDERLVTQGLGFFGALALLLACVGLYGVMTFTVTSRTIEIGVRMALGATRTDVLAMVLRDALTIVGVGLALGLVAALVSTRLLDTLLFGIAATDPITIVATTVVMLAVALLAGVLPARHAAGVDPLVALRTESRRRPIPGGAPSADRSGWTGARGCRPPAATSPRAPRSRPRRSPHRSA